ncbi:P-type conjugative transfer protein TrbL [compost metagenome]
MVSSGVKVLVLAVIVGIGTGLFAEFQVHPDEPSIDHALVVMLASLALLALGIFGPGIATGLVSGGPQLGAGALAGAALGTAGMAVAVGAAATGVGTAVAAGARMAPGAKLAAGMRSLKGRLAGGGGASSGGAATLGNASQVATDAKAQPAWARRLQRRQQISHAATTVAHTLRGGDGGGSGSGPNLRDSDS